MAFRRDGVGNQIFLAALDLDVHLVAHRNTQELAATVAAPFIADGSTGLPTPFHTVVRKLCTGCLLHVLLLGLRWGRDAGDRSEKQRVLLRFHYVPVFRRYEVRRR